MNPEYNDKIRAKVTLLYSKAEVARARIKQMLDKVNDKDIIANLHRSDAKLVETMEICQRTIRRLDDIYAATTEPGPVNANTEFSSISEYRKYQNMPPITTNEVKAVDIDKLSEMF